MAWSDDQLANANTIIDVGIELGASRRDIRIALMTAMQESSLNNYSGGDLDSVGLFQQRDAWGTFEQRHDPAQAAKMFFTGGHAGQRGLFDFADRDSMSLSEAAQSVQVSAYPDAYAKWHDEAAEILRSSSAAQAAGLDAETGMGAATTADAVQPISGAELVDSWHAGRDGHLHEGIDIMADRGTPIHAIVSGTVVQGFDDDIGGIVVRIEGDDGRYYYYAHLDGVADGLQVGDRVETGEVIGAVGSTGNAATTVPHLHLGIYEDDVAVNPYPLLLGLPNAEDAASGDDFGADTGAPPAADDSDQDGLTDEFERLLHTDVHAKDTDHDGRSDLEEAVVDHTDPTMAGDDGGDGGGAGKGLGATVTGGGATRGAFSEEVLAAGFGGAATVDSDKDGLSDLIEYQQGTDWLDSDTDHDTLSDELETRIGTNALDIDSDHDGITDGHEASANTLEPVDDLLP